MKKHLIWTLGVLVALAVFTAAAADINGAWKATMQGRDGQTMEQTFKLKSEGSTVTGSISGGMGGEAQIQDGKIEGDTVTFKVKREFNGNEMVIKYEGKISGDEIKFKSMREGSDRPPREFTAKRAPQS